MNQLSILNRITIIISISATACLFGGGLFLFACNIRNVRNVARKILYIFASLYFFNLSFRGVLETADMMDYSESNRCFL